MTKPNYELLKQAYAIIDGIPDQAFNLHSIILKGGQKNQLECGTIACAVGWLSLHPTILKDDKIKFVTKGTYKLLWKSKIHNFGRYVGYTHAMEHLFNISHNNAFQLFKTRDIGEGKGLTDKQVWQKRVKDYLRSEGQL